MLVEVAPYSPDWPRLFAQEASRLQVALAPWLAGDVVHVGSTAVPGLAAKPVLDMLAPVARLETARQAVPVLSGLGYRHADHRPHEALWFFAQQGERYDARTHQLHLTEPGGALWCERLAFRDALRADPALRAEYQALKQDLAVRSADLADYTRGKRDLVARVLRSRGLELG